MFAICFRRLRIPTFLLFASLVGHVALAQTAQTAGGAALAVPLTDKIVSAVAALLFSGVGGALFQRWLARAKPRFEITSIGFTGTQGLIRLDDDLLSRSIRDSWGPTLRRYEPYDELMERDRKTAETAERLKKALSIAEEWLEANPSGLNKEAPTCLGLDEIKKHPFVRDTIIATKLNGLCRRNEIGSIPYSLETVQKSPRLTDLTMRLKKEEWYLFLGKFGVIIPFKDVDGEARLKDIELLAESFARGIRENLIYYTKRFVDESRNDLLALGELNEHLALTMVPEAHLSVVVSFYNSGNSAATIRPHMGLRILHDRLKDEAFIMSNIRIEKNAESTEMLLKLLDANASDKRRGRHVVVEGILPETNTAPYLTIAPGQSCEARLVATEPLGKENGESLRAIYKTGLLKCQVVCQTVSGNNIWSSPAEFSSSVTQESRQNLQKILSKGKQY